jgi:hypothetical protein
VKPSVGRIVHYVSLGTPLRHDGTQEFASVCRAAVIAEVYEIAGPVENVEDLPRDPVALCVLNPSGMFFNEAAHDEDAKAGGTWHWPERVEDHEPGDRPPRY